MMCRITIVLIAIVCAPILAAAATIAIDGNTDDRQISASNMPWVGQPEARVGNGNTEGSCAVLVFELPVLPAGETVDTADLVFSITGGNNWNSLFEKSMDLYGIRLSGSSTVVQSDYYKGDYGADATATAIQDSIVYECEALNQGAPGQIGRHDTSTAGEAALGAWLQTQYNDANYNPAVSNFVFLRLNARDDFTSTYRYWSVATANNADETARPTLTLSTIPEPATLTLLAAAGLGLVRRRK